VEDELEGGNVLLHQGRGEEVAGFLSKDQQVDKLVPVRTGRDLRVREEEICLLSGGVVVGLDSSLALHDADDHCCLREPSDFLTCHFRCRTNGSCSSGRRRGVIEENDVVITKESTIAPVRAPVRVREKRRQHLLGRGEGHTDRGALAIRIPIAPEIPREVGEQRTFDGRL
jgi:hypothetical protein